MKHNNQIHSCRKFRKYWQRYVKTWFNQPARKKSRRVARDKKVPSRELGPRGSLYILYGFLDRVDRGTVSTERG